MPRIAFSLLLLLLSLSCNRKIHRERSTALHRVTVATGGCHGKCPFEAVELNEDGSLWYYGGLFSEKKGTYRGTVSEADWNKVVEQLNNIYYLKLDSQYMRTMDDMRMEIVFKYGEGHEKRIAAQSASLPENVRAAFMNIIALKDKVELEKTTEKHEFDTVIQKRSDDEK